jgi:uncharacterized membrane protein required for colicin V production
MEHLQSISPVDIVVLAIIVVNIIIGIKRGLSGELAGLVGTIAAFGLGVYFLGPFGAWLQEHTRLSEKSAGATAFITVAVGVLVVMILLRLILKKIMKITFEPTVERVGGCVAGIIRSVVLVLIIFVAILMCPHDYLNRTFGEESIVGKVIAERVMPRLSREPLVEKAKSEVRSTIDDLGDDIKKR